jgi:hypothetical protein
VPDKYSKRIPKFPEIIYRKNIFGITPNPPVLYMFLAPFIHPPIRLS